MDIDNHNPLLDFSGLPLFTAITPEHVQPALEQLLAENRKQLEQLLAQPSPLTWDNFIQPLEDMDERLHRMWSPVSHLNAVRDNDVLRAVYDKCLPLLTEYATELGQDPRLYAAYKKIADSKEFNDYTYAQRRIINNALRDFRLSGAELDDEKKQQFKDIAQQLSVLSNQFAKNVLDATQAWELVIDNDEALAGLPESAVAQARQAADQVGKDGWRFTLDAPSYIAFMTYADNRELRQDMYQAFVTRASDEGPHAGRWDNSDIIVNELELRRQKAQLLGYSNYAELSMARKMASSADEVIGFLEDLASRSKEIAVAEIKDLRKFARQTAAIDELQAWDVMYFSEKLRQQDYELSQEDLRPYFPLPKVLDGMFEVVHRLYGITIELDQADVWHQDVKFFVVRNRDSSVQGQFYVDLYAREHKRGGAWMDECISRKKRQNRIQTPVAYLTCNFSPPTGGHPSLLTHQEVVTLFHEFGHGLHHLLTQVDYVSVSGINGVEWDAVELPSQFMENWCWEKQAIDSFGGHYQTGQPLPESLYQKMNAARHFQSGMQMVRQLEFALFDMQLHIEPAVSATSVWDCLDSVRQKVAVLIPPEFNRFQNSFTHIFAGGYAAGYYSYKWAEVLSADAFGKFEENGIFDRQTGHHFLSSVLEKGGTRDAMELFIEFRGRKPEIDALLRHTGLAA